MLRVSVACQLDLGLLRGPISVMHLPIAKPLLCTPGSTVDMLILLPTALVSSAGESWHLETTKLSNPGSLTIPGSLMVLFIFSGQWSPGAMTHSRMCPSRPAIRTRTSLCKYPMVARLPL